MESEMEAAAEMLKSRKEKEEAATKIDTKRYFKRLLLSTLS